MFISIKSLFTLLLSIETSKVPNYLSMTNEPFYVKPSFVNINSTESVYYLLINVNFEVAVLLMLHVLQSRF